ncbi:MAG: FAD-binding protein [Lachnospiraceae bacterium]|nr:FAD-binding protein [Lachnospiraceae bacterium]MBR3003948.1 FAD-binding protein [Lachnospiraceae bacterium]
MKKTIEVDVAIMGSGVAGMGAAYKLAEKGVTNVAIFEKYPAQGGAVSNCPMGLCTTPDTVEAQTKAFEVLSRFANYSCNMGALSKLIKYSSEFPRIFFDELKIGIDGVVKRPPEDYGNQRGYTMGHANGLDVGDIYFITGRGQGHAMALALLRLRLKLEKQGFKFYFRTPIKKIIREPNGGKVTGAIAYDQEGNEIEIKCKALIVASGGMTGNLQLMKDLGVVNTKFEECYTDGGQVLIHFNDSCQDGDGQLAVWEIGGKKTGIVISADPEVPNPWVRIGPNTPWLAANQTKIITEQPYLRVDELGRRFINEEMSSNHSAISTSIVRNNPNMACYMIFDEDTAKHMAVDGVEDGYVYFIFQGAKIDDVRGQMDEMIAKGNKHVCHFDTIHEVCEYMGIDEKGLKKTIAKYNHAKEIGYDEDFKTNPKYIRPVREESGHIYCYRILAGAYDTMGGLAIDENANILDVNNYPIEGLYGGGDMVVGSIFGEPPHNAGGNVYGSMPTGMLAGDSAAAYVKGEA